MRSKSEEKNPENKDTHRLGYTSYPGHWEWESMTVTLRGETAAHPYSERDGRGNSFIEWEVLWADNWSVDRIFVDQQSHGDAGFVCANQVEWDYLSVGDAKVR